LCRSYTHNLTQLLEVSGVKVIFEEAIRDDEALRVSWSIVKDWSETSRYTLDNDGEVGARICSPQWVMIRAE
jgi:hypothetical protein